MLRHAAGSLLSILYPSQCPLCLEELKEFNSTSVCESCFAALDAWRGPVCSRCGLPMASVEALEAAERLCPSCREGQTQLERARSFGLYRDTLRAAILLLKFQRRQRWGLRLGGLLTAAYDELLDSGNAPEVILVPVPLHSVRFRQRGYNQAELLCRGLLRQTARRAGRPGLQLEVGALQKTRATPPQTGLSLAARRENVRGAFAVMKPERIRGRVAVLVDDVMTTGATLAACAAALERAGASKVLGLTLARATPQFPDTRGAQGVD